jgi:hypothetical protein
MTTDPTAHRFPRDPQLQQLHSELVSPAEPDDTVKSNDNDTDRALDSLLPALDHQHLSPVVQRYVTELLQGGEVPAPAIRRKFITAANRGLNHRKAQLAPLPVLLAAQRHESDRTASDIAEALDVPESAVHDMESGNSELRELGATLIVRWITALDVEHGAAITALTAALQRATPAAATRAAGRGRLHGLSPADQALVDEVASLLDADERPPP